MVTVVALVKGVSSLTKANKETYSIRTTVPKEIVVDLELDPKNDKLLWESFVDKGKKYARVSKWD